MRKLSFLFLLPVIILIPLSSQKTHPGNKSDVKENKGLSDNKTTKSAFDDFETQGLVAYLPFNGNTNDSSGNGHHSTSKGVSYTYDRFGHPNSAAEFNGEMNSISLKGFRMADPNSTLTFWFLPTPETDTILTNTFPLSLKLVLRIVDKKYDLEITIGIKKIHIQCFAPIYFDPSNPKYDFIAISYSSSEILMNVNQRNTGIHYFTPGEIENLFPLTIKKNPVYSLRGKVDDVRIYSRRLTYEELNTLNENRVKRVPEIKIDSVYSGYDYAMLYTHLIDDYTSRITEYGIGLSTHPNLDTSDTKYKFHGYFDLYLLPHLSLGTTYYVRVYGKNEVGIGYSNEVSFKMPPDIFGTLTDIDSNVYKTVKIGAQTWMAENLKTTRYADGTPISDGDIAQNMSGKYYVRNYEVLNKYGLFYTWPAATNTDTLNKTFINGNQGVCPDGWHLPATNEYSVLIDYLGGHEIAGRKLKVPYDELWVIGNGINESGFGGMGLGYAYYYRGIKYINRVGERAYFWTSERDTTSNMEIYNANFMVLSNDISVEIYPSYNNYAGASVRCIQDTISIFPGEEDHKKTVDDSGSFDMYPNPASDVLNFPNLSKPVIITIYDTQSRVRLKTNVTSGNVDISFLPKGIYFIHISDGITTEKKKFVK